MPREKKGAVAAAKKAPAKRGGARKMPPPLPKGVVLTDFTKKVDWMLGTSVGKGGFGEIYTASKSGHSDGGDYVIKIEPHENGPLFTELSFYRRVAKSELITDWCKSHGLSYLAIPEFVAAGEHTYSGLRYRFMVMHRFGEDIEKKFTAAGRQFGMKTVCYLALRLLEALEFLHESEYVHADVKGSNLLTGLAQPHQVYLVDYGLAYRYSPDGVSKEYSEDPRRKHDGTIEFTSIDAHKGANPSRRADLEILGYCLLQWAAGRLPWEGNLEDKEYVAREKIKYKSNVGQLMTTCFHSSSGPSCLRDYMKRVYKLEYTEQPDYTKLKGLFLKELRDIGCKDDRKDLDWLASSKKKASASPVKKTGAIPAKPPAKRRKAASAEKEPAVSNPALNDMTEDKVDIIPGKPVSKRRKAVAKEDGPSDAIELTDSPADIIPERPKSKRAASSKAPPRAKRQDSADKIPEPHYPAELGYVNGDQDKVSKKRKVEDVEEQSPEPVVRRTRSSRRK